MNDLLQIFQLPVITGVAVPLFSFLCGYALFRAQRREESKLEVFRRRLNAYEQILAHLETVDIATHERRVYADPSISAMSPDNLAQKTFTLRHTHYIYLPLEISSLLDALALALADLPDSMAEVEELDGEITVAIHDEVGQHLDNWYTSILKLPKNNKEEQDTDRIPS